MTEEMVTLDRKTGIERPKPEIHTHDHTRRPQQMISRKALKEVIMPKVGDLLEGDKVIYVHGGKFRYSAETTKDMPLFGAHIIDKGRVFEVNRLDIPKKRYSAEFKGFEENKIEDAPVEETEDLLKVLE